VKASPSSSSIPEHGTPGHVDPFPVGMKVKVIPGSGSDTDPRWMQACVGKIVSRLDEEHCAVFEFGKERAVKKGKRVHRDKIRALRSGRNLAPHLANAALDIRTYPRRTGRNYESNPDMRCHYKYNPPPPFTLTS
jgi:hypothetical protein